MKKVYLSPFVMVISINTNDIISTSGEQTLDYGGDAVDGDYSDAPRRGIWDDVY